jgi:hypothetical protein
MMRLNRFAFIIFGMEIVMAISKNNRSIYMKRILPVIFLFFLFTVQAQSSSEPAPDNYAFKAGEWLKFRMSYSNFLNAGYSEIEVNGTEHQGQDAFHIIGKGKSTGLISLFFKVRDNYETFMFKESMKPYRFIRQINEGGYTKNKEIHFDYDAQEAIVKNYKHNTVEKYPINSNIQDMLSTLYFMRNQPLDELQVGDEIEVKMFFDQETNNFKLRFLGMEIIRTKFGKIKSLKFRPFVQAGRVFKEEESVTVWVSADKNRIPLRIKASLAVGSLRADLDEFKGLSHPFNIIFDN